MSGTQPSPQTSSTATPASSARPPSSLADTAYALAHAFFEMWSAPCILPDRSPGLAITRPTRWELRGQQAAAGVNFRRYSSVLPASTRPLGRS